jgi:hypothetical protein
MNIQLIFLNKFRLINFLINCLLVIYNMYIYLFIICLTVISLNFLKQNFLTFPRQIKMQNVSSYFAVNLPYIRRLESFQTTEPNLSLYPNQVININDLKYGTLNQIDLDFVQTHQVKSFPLPLPLSEIKNPQLNQSNQTLKELDLISNLSQNATTDQKKTVDQYEKDIFNEFLHYCQNNKLIYSLNYLEQIINDVKLLCYKLKIIYNRPRPYQLGFYLSKKIINRPIVHSFTPSYPSYSTLLSKTLANVLSYNNPAHTYDLNAIAKEIALCRLLGGFNYPSDNAVALEIAAILKNYIKYYEIDK